MKNKDERIVKTGNDHLCFFVNLIVDKKPTFRTDRKCFKKIVIFGQNIVMTKFYAELIDFLLSGLIFKKPFDQKQEKSSLYQPGEIAINSNILYYYKLFLKKFIFGFSLRSKIDRKPSNNYIFPHVHCDIECPNEKNIVSNRKKADVILGSCQYLKIFYGLSRDFIGLKGGDENSVEKEEPYVNRVRPESTHKLTDESKTAYASYETHNEASKEGIGIDFESLYRFDADYLTPKNQNVRDGFLYSSKLESLQKDQAVGHFSDVTAHEMNSKRDFSYQKNESFKNYENTDKSALFDAWLAKYRNQKDSRHKPHSREHLTDFTELNQEAGVILGLDTTRSDQLRLNQIEGSQQAIEARKEYLNSDGIIHVAKNMHTHTSNSKSNNINPHAHTGNNKVFELHNSNQRTVGIFQKDLPNFEPHGNPSNQHTANIESHSEKSYRETTNINLRNTYAKRHNQCTDTFGNTNGSNSVTCDKILKKPVQNNECSKTPQIVTSGQNTPKDQFIQNNTPPYSLNNGLSNAKKVIGQAIYFNSFYGNQNPTDTTQKSTKESLDSFLTSKSLECFGPANSNSICDEIVISTQNNQKEQSEAKNYTDLTTGCPDFAGHSHILAENPGNNHSIGNYEGHSPDDRNSNRSYFELNNLNSNNLTNIVNCDLVTSANFETQSKRWEEITHMIENLKNSTLCNEENQPLDTSCDFFLSNYFNNPRNDIPNQISAPEAFNQEHIWNDVCSKEKLNPRANDISFESTSENRTNSSDLMNDRNFQQQKADCDLPNIRFQAPNMSLFQNTTNPNIYFDDVFLGSDLNLNLSENFALIQKLQPQNLAEIEPINFHRNDILENGYTKHRNSNTVHVTDYSPDFMHFKGPQTSLEKNGKNIHQQKGITDFKPLLLTNQKCGQDLVYNNFKSNPNRRLFNPKIDCLRPNNMPFIVDYLDDMQKTSCVSDNFQTDINGSYIDNRIHNAHFLQQYSNLEAPINQIYGHQNLENNLDSNLKSYPKNSVLIPADFNEIKHVDSISNNTFDQPVFNRRNNDSMIFQHHKKRYKDDNNILSRKRGSNTKMRYIKRKKNTPPGLKVIKNLPDGQESFIIPQTKQDYDRLSRELNIKPSKIRTHDFISMNQYALVKTTNFHQNSQKDSNFHGNSAENIENRVRLDMGQMENQSNRNPYFPNSPHSSFPFKAEANESYNFVDNYNRILKEKDTSVPIEMAFRNYQKKYFTDQPRNNLHDQNITESTKPSSNAH